MIDIHTAPPGLIDALQERGQKPETLSGREAFNEFCMWHGLIGWGPTLYTIAKFCIAQDKGGK
jgi:hypothetical protein